VTNKEFVSKLLDVAQNYKTKYVYAVFGSPVTEAVLTAKQKQSGCEWFYTSAKMAELRQLIGKGYFGFDCVNLIKGILWGWNGNASDKNGGAVYKANGVPDTNADGLISLCKNVSTDFSKIEVGDVLWMSGHVGVYIGDGKAVECTTNWSNNVQITAVYNIGVIGGLNGRRWTKYGKMPYITYEASVVGSTSTSPQAAVAEGDTVTIKSGAVYGGLASSRGTPVPSRIIGQRYKVTKFATHKGVQEALLQGINSWVAVASLNKV